MESSVPYSISDGTMLDSPINPRSRESRNQGSEHKQSAQSLNLGVLERGLEAEHYVMGLKNECLIDRSRASSEVAGTSEDSSLMKVVEGFTCADNFLHNSLLDGGDVIVTQTKLADNSCHICEDGNWMGHTLNITTALCRLIKNVFTLYHRLKEHVERKRRKG